MSMAVGSGRKQWLEAWIHTRWPLFQPSVKATVHLCLGDFLQCQNKGCCAQGDVSLLQAQDNECRPIRHANAMKEACDGLHLECLAFEAKTLKAMHGALLQCVPKGHVLWPEVHNHEQAMQKYRGKPRILINGSGGVPLHLAPFHRGRQCNSKFS